MAGSTYRRADPQGDWWIHHNELVDRDAGNANGGRKVSWTQYDGTEIDPQGGGTLSTNNYTHTIRSTVSNHRATLLAATSAMATPSTSNAVELVSDTGLFIGSGKALRIYGAGGSGYGGLTSDNNGLLTLAGSGSSNGGLALTFLTASSYVAIGATPASAGAVRLTKATAVTTRNNGNSADITLVTSDTSDNALFGDGTNATSTKIRAATDIRLVLGSTDELVLTSSVATWSVPLATGTNPSSSGQIRIPNNTTIKARNAANGGDIIIATVGTDDVVYIGANTTQTNLQGTVVLQTIDPPTVAGQATAGSLANGVYFGSISAGVLTDGNNYNVASVTRNSAGDYSLLWDRDFASANYSCVPGILGTTHLTVQINAQTAGGCDIFVRTPAGVKTDPAGFSVQAFGTLS